MKISPAGVAFIKKVEGLRLKAYQDVAGVWTIGYGHTGGWIEKGLVIDESTAGVLLSADLQNAEADVARLVTAPLLQHEFDALVSFVFNVGSDIDADDKAEGLGDSTLLKLLNSGDRIGAAAEFAKWHHAGGNCPPFSLRSRRCGAPARCRAAGRSRTGAGTSSSNSKAGTTAP
jgi:lysozyme